MRITLALFPGCLLIPMRATASASVDHSGVPPHGASVAVAGPHLPTSGPVSEVDGEIRADDYDKIFVIPDVHGDLDMFVRTLWLALVNVEGTNDVISEADLSALLQGELVDPPSLPISTFSRVAVIQLGDLMNRGPKSIECFRVMQNIARVFGWKTISLYGNHEVMNMAGQFSTFLNLDDIGGFGDLVNRIAAVQPEGELYEQIVDLYQGMVRLVGPASDPTGATNTLFVHGGVTRRWLRYKRMLADGAKGSALVLKVNDYFREAASDFDGVEELHRDRSNPVWTRRLAYPFHQFEGCGEVDELLKLFQVSRIIVGHTPQDDYSYKQLCDGKIIMADVKMSRWIDWSLGRPDPVVAGNPSLILMSMDWEHRLDSIVPHSVVPATGVNGVSLPLLPIHGTTPTSVCSVTDLQTLGNARLIEHMSRLPEDISAHVREEALMTTPYGEVSRPCLRHFLSARRRDMRGACRAHDPNSPQYIMCDFRESIRLAAMSTDGESSTGVCGSVDDRDRLMNLDIEGLSAVGNETVPFLYRMEWEVSENCGRCLRAWADLEHCRSLPSGSENETIIKITCARLDRFAGVAHCLVPSDIPPSRSSP